MQVILLKDVKDVGKQGDIVEVSDGYGQNFLLRRNLARVATKGVVRNKRKEMAEQSEKASREQERAKEMAVELEKQSFSFSMRVGENNKLFGSVTSKDIAELLRKKGYELTRKNIKMGKALRNLGSHKVKVQLHPKVSAQLSVDLVAE